MESSFVRGLNFVLAHEGGYVNHPNDLGKKTNKGITQRTYDNYRGLVWLERQSVKLITNYEVSRIYRTEYWDALKLDNYPPALAISMFDWGVNAGTSRAIKTLQAVLGVKADGIAGEGTKAAMGAYRAKHGLNLLVSSYNLRRLQKYEEWGVGDQAVFLDGWKNRLNDLKLYVGVK